MRGVGVLERLSVLSHNRDSQVPQQRREAHLWSCPCKCECCLIVGEMCVAENVCKAHVTDFSCTVTSQQHVGTLQILQPNAPR